MKLLKRLFVAGILAVSGSLASAQDQFNICELIDGKQKQFYFHLEQKKVDPNYVKQVKAIVDRKGDPYFGDESIEELRRHKIPLDEICSVTDLVSRYWNYDEFTLTQLLTAGVTSDCIRDFAKLNGDNSDSFFSLSQIIQYVQGGGAYTYAERLCTESGIANPQAIIYFNKRGLDCSNVGSTFTDTEKPNAIVIVPTNDYNSAFDTDSITKIFSALKKEYDLYVAMTDNEDNMYRAIENIPEAELLFICGHGTPTTLSLGNSPSNKNQNESYTIDTGDDELEEILCYLHPSAMIVLDSCSTAAGAPNADNLAKFIYECAGGRSVTASKADFSSSNIVIGEINPFSIKFIVNGTDQTHTYSATK